MRKRLKQCKHCGATRCKIRLYWSTVNLLKVPIKTYYCDHCAKIVVPKADFILETETA
jgi:hypothetical protein